MFVLCHEPRAPSRISRASDGLRGTMSIGCELPQTRPVSHWCLSRGYASHPHDQRTGGDDAEEDVECLAADNAPSLICPLTNAKFILPYKSKVREGCGDSGRE